MKIYECQLSYGDGYEFLLTLVEPGDLNLFGEREYNFCSLGYRF